MHGEPHTHEVRVISYATFWDVEYGDQREYHLSKLRLRPGLLNGLFSRKRWLSLDEQEASLRETIADLIRRHDAASREVAMEEALVRRVMPSLPHSKRWASEQLRGYDPGKG